MDENKDESLRLTMWGCLECVLRDYNIDASHITPKMSEHLVNDYMELLERQGYIEKADKYDSNSD